MADIYVNLCLCSCLCCFYCSCSCCCGFINACRDVFMLVPGTVSGLPAWTFARRLHEFNTRTFQNIWKRQISGFSWIDNFSFECFNIKLLQVSYRWSWVLLRWIVIEKHRRHLRRPEEYPGCTTKRYHTHSHTNNVLQHIQFQSCSFLQVSPIQSKL